MLPIIQPFGEEGQNRPIYFLRGGTGKGKSFLLLNMQNFFGNFTEPVSWTSTPNSIQRLGYFFKDCMYLVDDYKQDNITKVGEKAARALMQNYADMTGRSRLRSDATMQKTYHIRGGLMISGEDLVSGEASNLARMVIVEYESDKVDLEKELIRLKAKGVDLEENSGAQLMKQKMATINLKEGFGMIDDLLGGFGAKFMSGMTNPLGLIIAAVAYLVKLFTKWDERQKAIGSNWGALALQSAEVRKNVDKLATRIGEWNMELEEAIPAMDALQDSMGITVAYSAQLAGDMLEASKTTALSVEETSKLAATLSKITDISDENLGHMIETGYAFAEMAGTAATAVMKDIAANTEAMSKFAFAGAQNLFRAATAAKKLGASMSDVASMAEAILDFESSIENEMQLSVMLGKRIDFNEARRLGSAGKLDQMMDNITGQLGRQVDLSKLDYHTQKQLMTTLNLTDETMLGMIRAQQEGVDLSAALNNNFKDAGESAKEITPEDAMSALEHIQASLKTMENLLVENLAPQFEMISGKIKVWSIKFNEFIEHHMPDILWWIEKIGYAMGAWQIFKMGKSIYNLGKMFGKEGAFGKHFAKGGALDKALGKGGWLQKRFSGLTQSVGNFFSKLTGGGGKPGLFGRAWSGIKGAGQWLGGKVSKAASFLNPGKLIKGSIGKIAKAAVKGGLIGMLLNAGSLASILTDKSMSQEDKARQSVKLGGSIVGGLLGSVIGSLVPGVGTFIGGLGGSMLGSWIGGKKWAQDAFVPLIKDWMPAGQGDMNTVKAAAGGPGAAAVVTGPAGSFALSPNDSLVAGTNLGGSNKAFAAMIGKEVGGQLARIFSQKPTTVITKEEFKQFLTNVNY